MTQSTLLVCVLCRASEPEAKADLPLGQALFDQLSQAISSSYPQGVKPSQDGITLQAVRCMAACRSACVAAFAAPDKLTFILSELSPTESVSDLLQFSHKYAKYAGGKVPYRERPETIKKKLYAVLPPLPNHND